MPIGSVSLSAIANSLKSSASNGWPVSRTFAFFSGAQMNAVFLDYQSIGPGDLDCSGLRKLLPGIELYDATLQADVAERISNVEIVIVNKVMLGREQLVLAKKLRMIAITATGTNNIDLEAARELGIRVSNARDYGTDSVVQHVFCLMLALANRLQAYMQDVQSGVWSRQQNFCLLHHPITELRGKTLGLIGYGVLGRAVARMAECWGMRVLIAKVPGRAYGAEQGLERHDLAEILAQSDVISVHCLLSEQTQGMLGSEQLAAMKPGALLVNTARGGIVDETALREALRTGHLGGAATDVLFTEPPGIDDPMVSEAVPNLIVTPHCAWASRESRQRLLDQVVENVSTFLKTGAPLHAVC